ncbi:MAG: serine/threonine-protein kinase, partial [candidate division WOR-3 bacterium]
KARDRMLDRLVLLKVLQARWSADTELVQRFQREALLQARLKHHNIVTVYDYGGSGNCYYIASEYVEGETLEANLQRTGRIGLVELVPIVHQIVAALKFAHKQGVVHRDLKPANILVTGQGEVKLTDFGLAFARDLGSLTQEGTVIGTPAYMSPNQARGQITDFRTDIFTLGVVIYEALSGNNPFQADSAADAITRVLTLSPRSLASLVPGLPRAVSDVIDRMLTKDPEQRLTNLDELLRTLDRLTTVNPSRSRRHRLRWLLIPTATLALGALVWVIVPSLGRTPHSRTAGLVEAPALVGETLEAPGSAAPAPAPQQRRESVQSRPPVEKQARPQSKERTVPPESMARVPPLLQPDSLPTIARLKVVVSPWAEVLIDGHPAGTTPLATPLMLSHGRHKVTLKNPDYPELSRTVALNDSLSVLAVDLDLEFARVEICVVPWGILKIDNQFQDTTPLTRPLRLSPGRHTVHVVHPELGSREDQIVVEAARNYRFFYDLSAH